MTRTAEKSNAIWTRYGEYLSPEKRTILRCGTRIFSLCDTETFPLHTNSGNRILLM
jgi:hypothetical protein